jgi:hypothetical protein
MVEILAQHSFSGSIRDVLNEPLPFEIPSHFLHENDSQFRRGNAEYGALVDSWIGQNIFDNVTLYGHSEMAVGAMDSFWIFVAKSVIPDILVLRDKTSDLSSAWNRPNIVFQLNGATILIGEAKLSETSITTAEAELTKKLALDAYSRQKRVHWDGHVRLGVCCLLNSVRTRRQCLCSQFPKTFQCVYKAGPTRLYRGFF